ncbi:MAG: hypothetical protein FDZ70_01525 [Actinobacteria bacterium]|nr:MAG: hypothetical protein FDZ70_01525 [Actinomycetota bacterium]
MGVWGGSDARFRALGPLRRRPRVLAVLESPPGLLDEEEAVVVAHVAAGRLRARAFLAAALAAAALLAYPAAAHALTICIDPGHGGPYSNSNHNGLREKDVNLWIARDLRTELEARGHTVIMTRDSDRAVELRDIATWNYTATTDRWAYARDGLTGNTPIPKDDLQARCDRANLAGVDLFISVHNNGAPATSAHGTETHASGRDPLGSRLKSLVQESVVSETGLNNRGAWVSDFYVLRWTNAPAILVEGAYISNAYDASLLKSPAFRRRIAAGVAKGVARWLLEDPYRAAYPRLAGADRYHTAARISGVGWPGCAPACVLVGGNAYHEALVAAPLAARLRGPSLLTSASVLPTSTRTEIARLHVSEIVAVGSTETIADSVLDEAAAAAGIDRAYVRRIAGEDKYETAARVAEEVGITPTGTVIVANGDVIADALSIAPIAATYRHPIVLARTSDMPTATTLALALPHTRTMVIGGDAAVPATQLAGMANVVRVYGADRWATNAAVLRAFYGSYATLTPFVANGNSPADALALAPYAAAQRRPVLLTGGRVLAARTREWITNDRPRITGFTMIGGTVAQPYLTDWMLYKSDRE